MTHTPVLLQEAINGLALKAGSKVIDGTAGGGGHSFAICARIGDSGTLLSIDRDSEAVARVQTKLTGLSCGARAVLGNFRNMAEIARENGLEAADAILLDLGMSSFQLEEGVRGFSFQKDEPLLMTMGDDAKENAADVVNKWSEEELARIFFEYGEEEAARKVARVICEERKKNPIVSTRQLADIVARVVRRSGINPATKVFQALRIAVNDELGALKDGLRSGWEILSCGGRMAIISFHSLEDRIVKQFFVELEKENEGVRITKKPIVPSDNEMMDNPRSRSAKLRIIEKYHAGHDVHTNE